MARATASRSTVARAAPAIVPAWTPARSPPTGWDASVPRRMGPPEGPGDGPCRGSHRRSAAALEHPAVLTLGRGADESHVLAPPALLEARGIELLRVERGGEVTYHGPDSSSPTRSSSSQTAGSCSGRSFARSRPPSRTRAPPSASWRAAGMATPAVGSTPRAPSLARSARSASGSNGDELPRHRAQRGRDPRGLRPAVDPCGMPGLDYDVHRPGGRPYPTSPVHRPASPRPAPSSPGRSPQESTPRSRVHYRRTRILPASGTLDRLAVLVAPVPA